MTSAAQAIIYPVKDLARAKGVYGGLLGVEPEMDESYYVGFSVDGQHIGLDPNGHARGMTGPVAYWHVGNIHQKVGDLVAAGGVEQEPAHDVGGGRLVATVLDADGNPIGLMQQS
jgi:predicted enzyme related to lactoylglutathione lyase